MLHTQALCNIGVVYRELQRLEESVAAYEAALAVRHEIHATQCECIGACCMPQVLLYALHMPCAYPSLLLHL